MDDRVRRAAIDLLNQAEAMSHAAEVDDEHALIEIDPETGLIQVIGPYPDGMTALAALEWRKQYHLAETGPPEMLYLPVLIFPPNDLPTKESH